MLRIPAFLGGKVHFLGHLARRLSVDVPALANVPLLGTESIYLENGDRKAVLLAVAKACGNLELQLAAREIHDLDRDHTDAITGYAAGNKKSKTAFLDMFTQDHHYKLITAACDLTTATLPLIETLTQQIDDQLPTFA